MNFKKLRDKEIREIANIERVKTSDEQFFESFKEYNELIEKQKWDSFNKMPEQAQRIFQNYCEFLVKSEIVPENTQFFVFGSYARGTAIGLFSDNKLQAIYRENSNKYFSDFDISIMLPEGFSKKDINIPTIDIAFCKMDDDQMMIPNKND